jgi:hypothetical protein
VDLAPEAEQQIFPDVYMYRCISPHGMRHGTPYAHSSKRPGDVDVSPLVPSLLAGLLRLRRLSLHTLVHGRLKPYSVQGTILGVKRHTRYCPLRIHTPYTTYYMNPYETRSAWCAVPWRSPALLYTGFPKARNISSVHVYPNFWNFEDLTRGRAFPKINLAGGRFPRNKIGHVIKMPKLHSVLEHQARF